MPIESRIEREPGLAELIATRLVDGYTHQEIADEIGSTKGTITRSYSRHPKVRGHIARLMKERTIRVDRKILSHLEARINDASQLRKMSVKELLEIRRELLGPAPQRLMVGRGVDEGSALAQLYLAAQTDPAIAAALETLGIDQPDEDAPEALPAGEDEEDGMETEREWTP